MSDPQDYCTDDYGADRRNAALAEVMAYAKAKAEMDAAFHALRAHGTLVNIRTADER